MIRCKNISLSYDENIIFNDFNLDVVRGQKVGVSGKSGKGKSTLLKLIQGNVIPQHGNIFIDNIELKASTINQIRKYISWIPQNINLPVNSGMELLRLMNAEAGKDLATEFIVKLGLGEEFLLADFNEISGGQKQRIIIAICLSLKKDIVLMDEPTSSLDDESIGLLVKTVKDLDGITVVSTSHNQNWLKGLDKTIAL